MDRSPKSTDWVPMVKSPNGTYLSKILIFPDATGEYTLPDDEEEGLEKIGYRFAPIEIKWYEDKVKIKIHGGNPAAITQAYLTGDGKDTVVELKPIESRLDRS